MWEPPMSMTRTCTRRMSARFGRGERPETRSAPSPTPVGGIGYASSRCPDMTYEALATDYDGTLAHDGIVDEMTVAALGRARGAGIKLLMVTGRELSDLFNT